MILTRGSGLTCTGSVIDLGKVNLLTRGVTIAVLAACSSERMKPLGAMDAAVVGGSRRQLCTPFARGQIALESVCLGQGFSALPMRSGPRGSLLFAVAVTPG